MVTEKGVLSGRGMAGTNYLKKSVVHFSWYGDEGSNVPNIIGRSEEIRVQEELWSERTAFRFLAN